MAPRYDDAMGEILWPVIGLAVLVALPVIGHYWQKRNLESYDHAHCPRCRHDSGLDAGHCAEVFDDGWGPTPCMCDDDYHWRRASARTA